MKRFIALITFLSGLFFTARADHITGGEMYYTFEGRSGSDYIYNVTLKLFMRCNSGRRFNNPTTVAVFDRINYQRIRELSVPLSKQESINLQNSNPCITNPPTVCYVVGYYYFTVSLPASANGYVLVSQVNYRIAGINNLTLGYSQVGATYTAEIPGTGSNANGPQNNSAHFIGNDLVVVCASNSFSYSFAAEDKDGDLLRYSFCNAYISGTNGTNVPPPDPPYPAVPYGQGFNGSMPLGGNVKLNSATGLITGIAPSAGAYVVTVCVEEIRHGTVISVQRKDLQINITECSIAAASLLPEYTLCKETKTLTIANLSTSSLIHKYNWQFQKRDGSLLFSSTTPEVTYTFPDTGQYKVQLYINLGDICSDSTTSIIKVYPGFRTGFDYSGICVNKPTTFSNTSQTAYGTIDSWTWELGDAATLSDTSHLKNPVYTYHQTGPKSVSMVVTNTMGCRDTVLKEIDILDKPPLKVAFQDTLICKGDTLTLHAIGNGSFTWSTANNTIAPNTSSPTVSPPVTTKYQVELNDNGCKNVDSLTVRVVDFVSLKAAKDTTICAKDTVQLSALTDGLQFSWMPSNSVNDPNRLTTQAYPAVTTTYQITARIGHCSATDDIIVTTVPYPMADAGSDTLICFNTHCQLSARTDGTSVSWSPSGTLSDASSLQPFARPVATTEYVLSAYDTKGCPKPGLDTVLVTVLPKIIPSAGQDTNIVVGQPLQLRASGGIRYNWLPPYNLSSTTIAEPVALFHEPAEGLIYTVEVFNEAGCSDSASIRIKVFDTRPEVFVPSAFTPNGDGKNDVLRPIAAGITRIEYFRIFNRWGQMVFSTFTSGQGWDGRIGGKDQNSETYVWEVKATDYKGTPYIRKGTVTLIR